MFIFLRKHSADKVMILILTGHGMDDSRVTRAISLCKKIVGSFSYSWLRRRALSEVQQPPNSSAQYRICHTLGIKAADDRKDPGTRGDYHQGPPL